MTDHHPSVWDGQDEHERRRQDARRCASVDSGRRCQLVNDERHRGWPHLHLWFEWVTTRRLATHCWRWSDGEAGELIVRPVIGPRPPWAACLRK
jgi:hypothetical protein